MNLRKHSHSLAYTLAAVVLFPLACERVDSGKRPGGGDGDGDGLGGDGPTGGSESGTGGATGGTSGFMPPGTGGMMTEEIVLPNPLLDYCSNSMGGMGGMPSEGSADGSLLIDDFEDGDNRVFGNGLSGRWESHNDGTEDGVQSPLGGFRWPDSDWTEDAFDVGRASDNSLHMSGTGFNTWGSGQAVYFAQDNDGLACLFDGSTYAGVTFWARGTVTPDSDDLLQQPKSHELGKVRVKVVDLDVISNGGDELEPDATAGGRCDQENYACWDSPVSRVEPHEDCWQKFVLPFDEMRADEWSKWRGEGISTLDASEIFQLAFEVSEKQSYEIWIDDIEFYTADDVPDEVLGCD